MGTSRRQRAARWIVLYELNDGPRTNGQLIGSLSERYDAAEVNMGLTTAKRRGHIEKIRPPGANCSTPGVWSLTPEGEKWRDYVERKKWESDLASLEQQP